MTELQRAVRGPGWVTHAEAVSNETPSSLVSQSASCCSPLSRDGRDPHTARSAPTGQYFWTSTRGFLTGAALISKPLPIL